MDASYRHWLEAEGYDRGTIGTQLSRVARIEEHYGSLDDHYTRDQLASLIDGLAYSMEDKRRDKANPTKIPIIGDIRSNLASYKSSVIWYRRFRESGGVRADAPRVVAPTRVVQPPRLIEGRAGPKTLQDFGLDGHAALKSIIGSSQYRTLAQAVASLTLFSHPATVRQTAGRALFPTVRDQRRVGQYAELNGRRVMLDDNKSATNAFMWANGLSRRGPDTQFNHVYPDSQNVETYSALPNICMTPAFIAKLTDTSEEVRRLLEYRSFKLYGWTPGGAEPPACPDDYEVLEWAAPLPAVPDVRATLEQAMRSKPKDRTVIAARALGWLFGEAA